MEPTFPTFKDIIKVNSSDILDKYTNYRIEIVNDPYDNKIEMYTKDNKKVLSAKYQLLGSYNVKTEIFNWACDQLVVDKSLISLSCSVKEYSKKIKKLIVAHKFSDVDYLERLYYYLTNEIFYIKPENIKDLVLISKFVTESNGIVDKLVDNIRVFYIITDVLSY